MKQVAKAFQDVQLRHGKRMVKILEQLIEFPKNKELLDFLVNEEHEKRKEDYVHIMQNLEGLSKVTIGPMDVLAREITDDSVIYLLKKCIQQLKIVRDE